MQYWGVFKGERLASEDVGFDASGCDMRVFDTKRLELHREPLRDAVECNFRSVEGRAPGCGSGIVDTLVINSDLRVGQS